MKYGVFDTVDELWIGDDKGPKLFDTEDPRFGADAALFAQAAAQIANTQMGWPPTRLEARPYTLQAVHLRDEVHTKMGPKAALRRLEAGGL